MLIVQHDDAHREFAYDRKSAMGRLDKALDEATARHWTAVSMKNDWKDNFPAGPTSGRTRQSLSSVALFDDEEPQTSGSPSLGYACSVAWQEYLGS